MTSFGWDGPLKIRWQFHLPELVSAIKQQISMLFKNPSGALRQSFSLGNFRVREGAGESAININNDLPYAAIQNYGGTIPERTAKSGFMHWTGSDGEDVYAKRARGFTISGKQYLERAVEDWSAHDLDIEWSD
jgi:hypothetical protein